MTKCLDLVGKKFNRLTVIKRVENDKKGNSQWLCECECGNRIIINGYRLKNEKTRSCGCLQKEKMKNNSLGITHGLSHHRLYEIWWGIKKRCLNSKSYAYKHYGQRGISICQEWLDDFMNFYNWAIQNGYKEDLSIDRIDVNGNYEPSNCRWATAKIQMNNTTRNHYITYNKQTKTLAQWADFFKVDYKFLKSKIRYNKNIEKLFARLEINES